MGLSYARHANRHAAASLQGLWALSFLAVMPVLLPFLKTSALPIIPHTHVDVVSGAAAAVSFMGELFLAKAILVYDTADAASSKRKAVGGEPPPARS